MQNKTIRERGKDGKFKAIKDNLEDTIDIFYLIIRAIPFMFVFLFSLNYFGLWKIVKKFGEFFLNIGNPECRVVCEAIPNINAGD